MLGLDDYTEKKCWSVYCGGAQKWRSQRMRRKLWMRPAIENEEKGQGPACWGWQWFSVTAGHEEGRSYSTLAG